jgi:hypothetical protein
MLRLAESLNSEVVGGFIRLQIAPTLFLLPRIDLQDVEAA